MEDKLYKKGFNAGYLLEKYLPALSQLLIRNMQNTEGDFFQGFMDGSGEFRSERDRKKSRLMAKLEKLPKQKEKKKDKDFDKEKE
jgi:hypothetical protein